MADDTTAYRRHYSKAGLWRKCKSAAQSAGRKVLTKALQLYFAAQRGDMSAADKALIYGALGYFILPVDLVPDFIVPVGYADDLSLLVATYTRLSSYVGRGERAAAKAQLNEWGV